MPINFQFKKNSDTFLKPANKYTPWKAVGLIIVGLLGASILFTIFFVYQYAYETIANFSQIVMLDSKLGIDPIDNKAFDNSQKNLKVKENLITPSTTIRNIFYYVETTSTTISTSKKQ
ncbi:MAG: hypothetical protein ACD_72C00526G0002 [uncultured bacterium]|nr:MAG: hypothetical protein ACD_72C00526G0002 [uncultured bacterium]